MVENGRVAAGTQAHLLIVGGQFVDVLGKAQHPVAEQPGRAIDEGHHTLQLAGELYGVKYRRILLIQAFNTQLELGLSRAVAKGLTHEDIV